MRSVELDAMAPIQISSFIDTSGGVRYKCRKLHIDSTWIESNDYAVLGTLIRRFQAQLASRGWVLSGGKWVHPLRGAKTIF